MPGSTKITDVIGEGNYFGINLIGNNPQISSVDYIESKGYVNFSVFPDKHCYITENEDFVRYIAEKLDINIDSNIEGFGEKTIAELEELYEGNSDSDNTSKSQSLGSIIGNLMIKDNDTVCECYEEYYDIIHGNIFNDSKKYGLREIPKPRNIYKDVIIDDFIDESYGKNETVPDMTVCAKVILKGTFSENIETTSIIQWKVIHPEKKWEVVHFGDVETYKNVFVQLPYLGNYDVEMTIWDIYNHCCKKYTKDAIIVEPYNIEIKGFYYDARPLPDKLKYDLMIPDEYINNLEKEYRYYLWYKVEGDVKRGIITRKMNPTEMNISDILGEYIVDGIDEYNGLENIRDIEKENWTSIINTESDEHNVLKISWVCNDYGNIHCGVDEFIYGGELTDVPFDENEAYNPEWNTEELYNVIKNNVDKMLSWALQEHLYEDCENTSMRNYRPDGSVNFEGPYYKFDVDNILYKSEKGYKEYDHLNSEIVNLEPGEHYKYVRYINNAVDIKPLTWILLGFDYTRITGRIVNKEYPKWTLTMVGNELDLDEDLRKDQVITEHYGLYFTYLFEHEGIYKIKLELLDINDNKYEIEKPIVIVDKDANYNMYHTLKDEYDKYLVEIKERNLIYILN